MECLMNYRMRFVTLYRRQGSRSSPWKRNAKSKMAVWGGLKNCCEKKWKAKEKKEKYTHLKAELHSISRRDKKAFLSDQCKETEENNRLGKTRDLFKKIRDTKGTFREKIGTRKGRKAIELKEAENIQYKWQEYTEDLYKKGLDPITTVVLSFT